MVSRARYWALSALLLSGCSNLQGLVGFNFTQAIDEQRVPGNPQAHAAATLLMGQNPLGPVSLSVDLAAQNRPYNIVIQRVKLLSLSFTTTATAQPQGCFDFVTSATISVESTRAGTTLPAVNIATASNPGCVNTLTFTPDSSVNLKGYIEEGMRMRVTIDGIPPASDVTFNGSIQLRAEAL